MSMATTTQPTQAPQQSSIAPSSAFENLPLAVLPGDDLTRFITRNPPTTCVSSSPQYKADFNKVQEQDKNTAVDDVGKRSIKIGTGIRCTTDCGILQIKATIAGRLLYRPSSNTWFVASNPRRYHLSSSPSNVSGTLTDKSTYRFNSKSIAGVGDRVIGIIEDQKASADYYRVNVFGSHPALLHVLSFEGATKRNRPYLEPGCLIYCRVVKGFNAGRMDPEVSCKVGASGNVGISIFNEDKAYVDEDDGGASSKDWLTNEGTYGPLHGGTSFRISLGLARELLTPKCVILSALDHSKIPFEIAVGVNGMVWVNSPEPEYTIMILNAIKNSEVMSGEQVRGMVKVMTKRLRNIFED